jgi:hypothetical protein
MPLINFHTKNAIRKAQIYLWCESIQFTIIDDLEIVEAPKINNNFEISVFRTIKNLMCCIFTRGID